MQRQLKNNMKLTTTITNNSVGEKMNFVDIIYDRMRTWQIRPPRRYFQFSARRLSSVVVSAQILFHSFSPEQQTRSIRVITKKERLQMQKSSKTNLWSLATNVNRHRLSVWKPVPYYIKDKLLRSPSFITNLQNQSQFFKNNFYTWEIAKLEQNRPDYSRDLDAKPNELKSRNSQAEGNSNAKIRHSWQIIKHEFV